MDSLKRSSTLRAIGAFFSVLLFAGIAAGQNRDDSGEIQQTVARVSFLNGSVSYARGDDPDNWEAADFNIPLTIGDRLFTGEDGRAELQVQGGFDIRVGAQADLAALNLTYDMKQWSLRSGYAAFQLRRLGENEVFEVDTPNAAITFERIGEYRVDVDGEGNTRVTVRRGRAIVAAGGGQVALNTGDQMNVDGTDDPRYDVVAMGAPDRFDGWVSERERRSESARSNSYVNADIVGVSDLDEHGRWQSIPSYGMVWTPTVVAAGWQPYRTGHWIWQDPWGWTWVAAEPWGWAPYHYGRWVNWSSRWWWVPVARTVRSVWYAPALVAFSGGGPGWSSGRGGYVGWFPLAPRDPFIHWWGPSRGRNVTNVTYVNRSYITVVNHNAFISGGLVTSNWVRDRSVVTSVMQAPILRGPLPIVPTSASLRIAVRPGLPPVMRPPRQVDTRSVVVRVAPPSAPPTFRAKLPMIEENHGQPVAPAAAKQIAESDRGAPRPVVVSRPATSGGGNVTFAPKSADSRAPRAEPIAPTRQVRPTPAVAPAPAATPLPDRSRRPDERVVRPTPRTISPQRATPQPREAPPQQATQPPREMPPQRATPLPREMPPQRATKPPREMPPQQATQPPREMPPQRATPPPRDTPNRQREVVTRPPDSGRPPDTGRPTPGPRPTAPPQQPAVERPPVEHAHPSGGTPQKATPQPKVKPTPKPTEKPGP